MSQLSPHFDSREFECQCGCGYDKIEPALVEKLEQLRKVLSDRPIHILSGCRCPTHNARIGGVRNSQHIAGKAADIRVPGLTTPALHDAVVASGLFKGIGFYPRRGFLHVDVRRAAKRWEG